MKARNSITGCALGMLLLSSCGVNEDLYDPAKVEERLKAEYKTNFVEKFGEFDSNYSWDATSAYPKYASTRADDSYFTYGTNDEGYYEVEAVTLEYLQAELVEGQNNRSKGKKFLMTVPDNAFTIVPIYQGSGLSFDFHVVIGNQDIEMWTKGGDGLQKKGGTTQGGGNPGYNKPWGGSSEQSGSSTDEWTNVGTGTTIRATAVRGIKYTFDATAYVGETMYFYLDITKGDNNHARTGTKQSSLKQMMVALAECPVPTNLEEGTEAMIIGCEDGDLSGSDWDMNDIVFLVYGNPDIPQPIEIINNEVKETTTKRYMIEDLGSTDDFDFNDVVVDVTQTRIKTLTITNGVITGTSYGDPVQKAVIRHLGGTLPFTLTIGGTQLDEMQGKMNANPDTEFTVTGWIPESNNISMKVNNGTSGDVNIGFPADGEVPMVIAVDEDVNWMEERVAITKEWFESIKK